MKIHKLVESWEALAYPNGVVKLIINCKTKEFEYSDYNDYLYSIREYDKGWSEDDNLQIPHFLDESITYERSTNKDKNQILVYFTPFDIKWYSENKVKKLIQSL